VPLGWEENVPSEAVPGGDAVPLTTLIVGELKEEGEDPAEKVAASDADPVRVGWEVGDKGLGKESVPVLLCVGCRLTVVPDDGESGD
jgi:hypothetical protein